MKPATQDRLGHETFIWGASCVTAAEEGVDDDFKMCAPIKKEKFIVVYNPNAMQCK